MFAFVAPSRRTVPIEPPAAGCRTGDLRLWVDGFDEVPHLQELVSQLIIGDPIGMDIAMSAVPYLRFIVELVEMGEIAICLL